MKRLIFLLVMMVMTAPSYTQFDRRNTSNKETVEYQKQVQEEKKEYRRQRTSERKDIEENRYYDSQRRKVDNLERENLRRHEDIKIIKPERHQEYEIHVRKTYRGEVRYKKPVKYTVVWTPAVRERIIRIYPSIRIEFHYGYRIPDIPAYVAYKHTGRLVNVFGYVADIEYIHRYDEYILYIGDIYPYHDLTVVISGKVARRIHPRPERFFINKDIVVTGVIYLYRDIPEIEVKDPWQINIYY